MAFPRMFNASTNSARVAFITGCATPKSIGRASALLLAQNGAKIVATDMPSLQGKGEELVAEIKKAGGDAVFVPLDVTKETEWQSAMEKAEKAFGPVDVVFNNAGIYPESNVSVPIWEQPTALYDKTMDVNVKGVYFGIKYGAKSMIKRGTKEAASIVNTSSIAGIGGNLGGFACELNKGTRILELSSLIVRSLISPSDTMSKHAVVGATKHAAIALAPKNIRVNSVHRKFFALHFYPFFLTRSVPKSTQLASSTRPSSTQSLPLANPPPNSHPGPRSAAWRPRKKSRQLFCSSPVTRARMLAGRAMSLMEDCWRLMGLEVG